MHSERKITGTAEPHNAHHGSSPALRRGRRLGWRPSRLLALAACAAVLGACGGGQTRQDAPDAPRAQRTRACAAVISDQGLREFVALAERAASGGEVALEDLNSLVATDVYARWRRSFTPDSLLAAPVARHMFIAMQGREQLPDQQRAKVARLDLVLNFQQTIERRGEIAAFISEFTGAERVCDVYRLLGDYLPAGDLPETLRLEFVAGLPEIRLVDGTLFVDASLAWASGHEQLVRALASILYRQISHVEGVAPHRAHGADILLQSLRLVRNEAIAAFIDGIVDKTYDIRHGRLAGASARPDDLLGSAYRTLTILDAQLAAVRTNPAATDEDWLHLHRLFAGTQAWISVGWLMANTINDQLGLAHLREAGRSVPDLFAAYQEACALLPTHTDAAARTADWYIANAPAFSPENAAWLDRELRRLFP